MNEYKYIKVIYKTSIYPGARKLVPNFQDNKQLSYGLLTRISKKSYKKTLARNITIQGRIRSVRKASASIIPFAQFHALIAHGHLLAFNR